MPIFGRNDNDTPAPAPSMHAAYGGVTYESHVETFMRADNDKTIAKRLGELGAQGWEPVAVLDRPLGLGKIKGDDAFAVILKRRVLTA